MVMSLGLGQYNLSLYHLANHAAFKAMLFMAAGAIIHAFNDQQDLRRYGGLTGLLPLVYSALLTGSASLMALPYMTGWYSKDGILEMAIGAYTVPGTLVYVLGTTVAGLTAFYSVRLLLMTFTTSPRSDYMSYAGVHEVTWYVMVPLVVLSVFAIVLGFITSDLYRGMGTDFMSVAAPHSADLVTSIDAEFGSITLYKLTPLLVTVGGSLAAYALYMTPGGVSVLAAYLDVTAVRHLYRYLNHQWQFDALIISVIQMGLRLGHGLSKVLDRGLLESVGPYGLQRGFIMTGTNVGQYSTGILTDYAMYIVLAMLTGTLLVTLPGLSTLGYTGVDYPVASLIMTLMVNTVSAYMVLKTPTAQSTHQLNGASSTRGIRPNTVGHH